MKQSTIIMKEIRKNKKELREKQKQFMAETNKDKCAELVGDFLRLSTIIDIQIHEYKEAFDAEERKFEREMNSLIAKGLNKILGGS